MWQDSCEAHSIWEKRRNVGAIGRITCKCTITLNARRIFIEKRDGIWKGFRDARLSLKKIRTPGAVGRVSYEFTVTVNARRISPEKKGIWGGEAVQRAFSLINTRIGRGWSYVPQQFKLKMKARRGLHEKTQEIWRGRKQ